MPEIDGPELHVIEFPAGAGEEFRAQAERHRAVARTRYLALLSQHVSQSDAATALDALTTWNDVTSGDRCGCSCHPRLPGSDLHDYGFDCPCRQTPDMRRRRWDEWRAETDAFWASPGGEQITGERQAEEAELTAWLALHPEVAVRSHGGMFPEQWWGEVDGRSFYWLGGDLDDPASFEPRSIDAGEIIAEGTTAAPGYGQTLLGRLHFIVDVIRAGVFLRDAAVASRHIDQPASVRRLSAISSIVHVPAATPMTRS